MALIIGPTCSRSHDYSILCAFRLDDVITRVQKGWDSGGRTHSRWSSAQAAAKRYVRKAAEYMCIRCRYAVKSYRKICML